MNRGLYKAYFIFVFLSLVWGMTYLFNKTASHLITPMQIVMIRVMIGFIPVFLYGLYCRNLHWRHIRYLHHFIVMSALAGSVYYLAFAKGIALLPSSIAGMLSGTIPLFSFIASAIFLRSEPINTKSVTGLICGFVGIALIANPWNNSQPLNISGVLYIFAGAACVGISFVYTKKFLSPTGISPVALCCYQLGLASVTLACVGSFQNMSLIFSNPAVATGLFIGLGFAGTGLAYICYYYCIGQLGALHAASATYLAPIIATITGVLILHEDVSALQYAGISIILAGVFLMHWRHKTPPLSAQNTDANCSTAGICPRQAEPNIH